MARLSRRELLCFLLCALCVLSGESVFAHPVPKANHDRTIEVVLTPTATVVRYHLDVNEDQAALDVTRLELPQEEFARITSSAAFYRAYVDHLAPLLAGNLVGRLDGEPVPFVCKSGKRDGSVKDHLRCDFTFVASWTAVPGRTHNFVFREGNYDTEDFDRIQLTLQAEAGVTLQSVTAPEQTLLDRPPLELKPGDAERLRRVDATFRVELQTNTPSKQPSAVQPDTTTTADDGSEQPQKLLHLLLDSRRGLVVLLLLAAGFGAIHALTPGHGKTLVAAYLVGRHGTVWHALLLGVMTTLTHTGAVFVLAGVFLVSPAAAESLYYVQGLVGGLFIAGLGLWLLFQRLFGRPDHVHLGGHSHHHHHHHHEPTPVIAQGTGVRVWHLVLLGVRGGLVPCWDAILLLCLAVSAQRLWLAIPLLLAFSAGLASVLVALGVSVVWARDWAISRWGEGQRMRKVLEAMPLVSAAIITALGLWLCYDSLHPEMPPLSPNSRP
jgi:ABC-type nickel/cobalt efflux system permease component RcnA